MRIKTLAPDFCLLVLGEMGMALRSPVEALETVSETRKEKKSKSSLYTLPRKSMRE